MVWEFFVVWFVALNVKLGIDNMNGWLKCCCDAWVNEF